MKICVVLILAFALWLTVASAKRGGYWTKKGGSKECLLDMAILIDESASITNQNFRKVKDFAVGLVNDVSKEADLQLGVIGFSKEAVVNLWLNDKENQKGFSAVQNLVRGLDRHIDSYATNSHLALFIARTQMLSLSFNRGSRCGAKKVLIIITDGYAMDAQSALNEAISCAAEGIYVVVVGTGPDGSFGLGSRENLANIYTGRDQHRVYRTDYRNLKRLSQTIVSKIQCRVINDSEPFERIDDRTYKKEDSKAPHVEWQ